MTEQYYYSRAGSPFGPFTARQLRDRAAAGRVVPTDLVWLDGSPRRCPASRVKNLFAPAPESPPAAPLRAVVVNLEPAALCPADPAALSPAPGEPAIPPPAPEVPKLPEAVRRPVVDKPRPKRVIGITGAILLGQDGTAVKFKKKCDKCKHEDGCRSTAAIRTGSTRVPFYCPKCRQQRVVVITGVG